MFRSRTAKVGLILALIALPGLIYSFIALTQRLTDRNIYLVRLVDSILEPAFEYQGHLATVEHITAERLRAEGTPARSDALRIHWRGQSADFTIPKNGILHHEHGLNKYRRWFGIFVFVDGEETEELLRSKWTPDEHGTYPVKPRLVVAARYTAEGYEDQAETWGAVRRREWVYRFAQLHPESERPDPENAISRWTKNYEQLDSLLAPSTYTVKYRPHLLPESEEQRKENLWMYYAMIEVTPASDVRGRNKSTEEVIRAMGWTWPLAVASSLTLALAIVLIAASRVTRPRFID